MCQVPALQVKKARCPGDTMMHNTPVVVSLPVADRRASFTFYRDGLGFAALGEPWEDGIPEPLQFALNDGVRVMLIPTDGFDRITGDHQVAPGGTSECVLVLATSTDEGVDEVIQRAQVAGADVITPPGQQPWGYAGAFADPDGHIWMVRSEGQVGGPRAARHRHPVCAHPPDPDSAAERRIGAGRDRGGPRGGDRARQPGRGAGTG